MAASIRLRTDYDGIYLRRLARTTKDAAKARRLLVLVVIYDGASRADAACLASVTL